MQPIEVPVATLPIKIMMGCVCPLIIFAVLWWGVPKFVLYLRILTGREPRKPGTKTIHLILGFPVYAMIFAPAVIAGAIFVAILTTPPSVVSDDGVTGGGGLLSSRKTIAWKEVDRVDCYLRRADHSVTRLRLVAGTTRIELAGGGDLTGLRDVIWARVPSQAVRSCSVPFRSH